MKRFIKAIILVVLFFVLSTVAMAENDPDCVLYLNFDQMSGTVARDASGAGNHADLVKFVGNPWVEGRTGRALTFDGQKTYLTVKGLAQTNYPNGITVEVWVKRLPGPGTYSLVRKQGCFNLYVNGEGQVGFLVPEWGAQYTTIVVPENQWTHVAATFDGSVVSVYINGVKDLEYDSWGEPLPESSEPLEIGIYSWLHKAPDIYAFKYYGGMMDDLKIYTRALAPEELDFFKK